MWTNSTNCKQLKFDGGRLVQIRDQVGQSVLQSKKRIDYTKVQVKN